MKVLIYVRPKSENFFRTVVEGLFANPEVITYSDYNYIADFWAGTYIYSEQYDKPNDEFEKLSGDILPRCRTLRKMKPELAHKLALRYWNGIEEFFSKYQFDYLFTMPVDCYTLDILCRIAQRNGVNIISPVGSAFEKHATLTVRGEYTKVREVISEEEINRFVEKMTQVNYLSPTEIRNVQKSHKSIYYYHFRRFLIEYGYYPLMKLRDKDPWNYHYNIYEVKGIHLRERYTKEFESKFTHIDELQIDRKTTVYYPMHLIPEASTDYWCSDIKVTNYNQYILNMICNADPKITFIIKEHPAMYGRRLLSFYDELKSLPNVILLHPMDRSNNLLLEVDNVVVDNGTVGIEALMRGKRVICLCDNYYQAFHPNAFLRERVTMDSLNLPLEEYDNHLFMKNLLQGTFVSDFNNSTNGIPNSDPNQLIKGIRTYLEITGLPI